MMTTRPANLGDMMFVACNADPEEKAQMQAMSGQAYDIDTVVQQMLNFPGPKWAVVDPANPAVAVAVGGLLPCRHGVWQSWFMARADAWVPGSGITEAVAGIVQQTLAGGAHRVETVCLASREKARRWYEMVGLTYEATLKHYGVKGEDAVIYVATRNPVGVTH